MHSVYKQNNLPYLSVKLCPNCDELIPVNSDVCPKCNYDFALKTVKRNYNEQKIENNINVYNDYRQDINDNKIEEDVPIETLIKPTNEKIVFCDNCGAKIIGSQIYCGGCGAKVSKRICQNCNQIIDANLAFCPFCGNKNENYVKAKEEVVVKQEVKEVEPTIEVSAPVEVKEEETSNVKQTELTNDDPIFNVEVNDETSLIEVSSLKEVVNMGRKRLFIIIQMLLVGLVAAIMIVTPLLTKAPFFTAILDCFKGSSSESIVSYKSLFSYLIECISSATSLQADQLRVLLGSENGNLILADVSFINYLLELIFTPDKIELIKLYISFFSVSFMYALLLLSMSLLLLTSIIGLFTKKPFKGKSLGFVVLTLFISLIFVYFLNVFFNDFKDYDSWIIYSFALLFLLWFIIKIVFLKENRRYKKAKKKFKKEKKMAKKISNAAA